MQLLSHLQLHSVATKRSQVQEYKTFGRQVHLCNQLQCMHTVSTGPPAKSHMRYTFSPLYCEGVKA